MIPNNDDKPGDGANLHVFLISAVSVFVCISCLDVHCAILVRGYFFIYWTILLSQHKEGGLKFVDSLATEWHPDS